MMWQAYHLVTCRRPPPRGSSYRHLYNGACACGKVPSAGGMHKMPGIAAPALTHLAHLGVMTALVHATVLFFGCTTGPRCVSSCVSRRPFPLAPMSESVTGVDEFAIILNECDENHVSELSCDGMAWDDMGWHGMRWAPTQACTLVIEVLDVPSEASTTGHGQLTTYH